MSKGVKNSKINIIFNTIIDRFETKLDKMIHKPYDDRKLINKPIDVISEITSIPENSIDVYLQDCRSKNLLNMINENLQRNLPKKRYDKIKYFIYNKDWIEILETIYVLLRVITPDIVVETGVGEIGMSTTYILSALNDNNNGILYSIDPDKFYPVFGYHVGNGVPSTFKERHRLVTGISQKELKPLLEKLGEIDVFLHDGDHKYSTKLFEYNVAYEHSKSGSIILSDDTWDSAFDYFSKTHTGYGYSVKYGNDDYFSFFRVDTNNNQLK